MLDVAALAVAAIASNRQNPGAALDEDGLHSTTKDLAVKTDTRNTTRTPHRAPQALPLLLCPLAPPSAAAGLPQPPRLASLPLPMTVGSASLLVLVFAPT